MNMTPKDSLDPARWVDDHGDALFRYALLRVRDANAAEDLVQEALLAAVKARHSFAGGSSVRTWLIGILKHKIADHHRSNDRAPQTTNDSEDSTIDSWFDEQGRWRNPPKPWNRSPSSAMESREFWEIFRVCLDDVPERAREAFSLRILEGMDSEDVCQVVGVSPTNFWVLMHRARARLRNCLGEHWFKLSPEGRH
jgi:RNA polymerase sigma-70 factor (ECF subfamily)